MYRNLTLYRGGEHGVLQWDQKAGTVTGAFSGEVEPGLVEPIAHLPAALHPTETPAHDELGMLTLLVVLGFDVPEELKALMPLKPDDNDLITA